MLLELRGDPPPVALAVEERVEEARPLPVDDDDADSDASADSDPYGTPDTDVDVAADGGAPGVP